MWTTQPVDYDPFASTDQSASDTAGPFERAMTRMRGATQRPPEHNSQELSAPERFALGASRLPGALAGGIKDIVETPGRAYNEGISQEDAANWGAATGLLMTGAPGAPKGAVGSGFRQTVLDAIPQIISGMQKQRDAMLAKQGLSSTRKLGSDTLVVVDDVYEVLKKADPKYTREQFAADLHALVKDPTRPVEFEASGIARELNQGKVRTLSGKKAAALWHKDPETGKELNHFAAIRLGKNAVAPAAAGMIAVDYNPFAGP